MFLNFLKNWCSLGINTTMQYVEYWVCWISGFEVIRVTRSLYDDKRWPPWLGDLSELCEKLMQLRINSWTLNELEKQFCIYESDKVWTRPYTAAYKNVQTQKASPWQEEPQPFNRQIIQSEFSPTWNCVSLTRSTTSSEWKLFRFDKMEVSCFQILLIDVIILCLKGGT